MIETKKDKIKDYVIAILLAIIAILIGVIYSKLLMDKNNDDIHSVETPTRKIIQDYFKALETDGYVLNDFSSNANFDYNLGTIKLFNKDYNISLKNNFYECEPECKYMYKLYINDNETYSTSFLNGIKVGVIGNDVIVEENHGNGNFTLMFINPKDRNILNKFNYSGPLNISRSNELFTIGMKEIDCSSNTYTYTNLIYNKDNDTFEQAKEPSEEPIKENNICN